MAVALDDGGGNSDNPLLVKIKCNKKGGCESDSNTADQVVKVGFGEVACFRVDDVGDYAGGKDCSAFTKDDWFLDLGVYLDDDTNKGLRAISCTNQFTNFQKGCGCKRYKRNPDSCARNDCIFIQKGDIFGKMSAERKKLCKADLGCREWDDCNFKCQEFCEMKGGRCQWANGQCEYNRNFGF